MPNPLVVAVSPLVDRAIQTPLYPALGCGVAPALPIRNAKVRPVVHGIGERTKKRRGREGILARVADCKGEGLAYLLGAPW